MKWNQSIFNKNKKIIFCFKFNLFKQLYQITEPAADAIFGHNSALSFATGPLIYDPLISPFGLASTAALSSQ